MLLPTSGDIATKADNIGAVFQLKNWEVRTGEGSVRTALLLSSGGMTRSQVRLLVGCLHIRLPDE